MYLVVGATGSLGGQIAKRLLADGERVRALVREDSPARAHNRHTDPADLESLGAELVTGDLRDRASLDAALAGVDVVISTASGTKRPPPDTTEAVDAQGNANLAAAAAGAGVRRMVLVSAAGADPAAPAGLFRDKGFGLEAVRNSGVPYTIVRPARFMADWIGFLVGSQLAAGGNVVELVGDGSKGSAFVDEADVAELVARLARDESRPPDDVVDISTERAHYPEIVERLGKAMGRDIEIRYVPVGESVTTLPAPVANVVTELLTVHAMAPAYEEVHRDVAERYGMKLTGIDEFLARAAAPQPA